ncbi:MAG: hypothetical protein IKS23_03755 [Alphaproteobacteria bacterium]|nr:hypothetical protein [Alphaproteobacteria bacterium]
MISTQWLDVAEAVCSRIIILAHGKIKIDGTCKEILKTTKSKSLEDAFKTLTRD